MRIASIVFLCGLCILIAAGGCQVRQIAFVPEQTAAAPSEGRLVTGRSIGVSPLSAQNVGNVPLNLVVSADGKYLISTSAGYREYLVSMRMSDGVGVSGLSFPRLKGKGVSAADAHNGVYYGLAAGQGVIYAAQGNLDQIAVARIDAEGKLFIEEVIRTRKRDFPSGLALDDNQRLYVANNDPQALPPEPVPSSVSIYDTQYRLEIGRFEFALSFGGTANFPLALAVTRDGKRLYVASQRDDAVYVLDTSDPPNIRQIATIPTGSHPIALRMDKAEKTLFVANAHSDTVSFVDVETNRIRATVLLRPDVAKSLAGATPTGLALSPDEKRLYVSLGDMNAIAVIDVPDRELDGYIPAGWYPTAVAVSADGKKLFVANAKGTSAVNPNPPATMPSAASRPSGGSPIGMSQSADASRVHVSPLSLLEGNVLGLEVPSKDKLKAMTAKVLEQNRLTTAYLNRENPLKEIGLAAGKIKHVIYIVKENRTYDHILGDLPQGNGNPAYCLFGREVTPNQHALAERFVLMDNFYCSGEVSGDGWTWSTQAMANEYTVRNVAYEYSDRGKRGNFAGTNNGWPTGGFPSTGPDGEPLSDHPKFREGAPPIPDVGEAPGGHLWDMALKHKLTLRNYGFFVGGGIVKEGVQITPDNYPSSKGLQPGGRDLEGLTDVDFRRFDMDYPDSDAWQTYYEQTEDETYLWPLMGFGPNDVPSRFSEWNREFQMMLEKDPTGGAVPNLMFVRFPTDHTAGANPGMKSPRAMVADNDFAVGQLVEAISKSPIWKHCAIFIIEDDAQDGPDHVDAHRSTCYVISPYIKKASIDHTFHNTASCLRTIELLLGLPPMCQYDAIASPIMNWDTQPRNDAAYKAILPPAFIIGETNPEEGDVNPVSPEAALMRESKTMDLTREDQGDAQKLNEILWKLSKGMNAKMPPTPKTLAGAVTRQKDDDD